MYPTIIVIVLVVILLLMVYYNKSIPKPYFVVGAVLAIMAAISRYVNNINTNKAIDSYNEMRRREEKIRENLDNEHTIITDKIEKSAIVIKTMQEESSIVLNDADESRISADQQRDIALELLRKADDIRRGAGGNDKNNN